MKNKKLILIFILLLAAFLRFYKLEDFPVGYHIDEISFGYNAWSLMETGADEYGVKFPLHLKAFGDYRPALYAYFLIPFFKIFGVKDYVIRYPSALFGALLVFPMYFSALQILKSKKAALIASFLTAISPWGIIVSRASSETVVSLFFFLVGFVLFNLGLDKKNTIFFLTGFFSWFLNLLFYHAARLFVPIFLILFLIFQFKKLGYRRKIINGFFYLFFIILPLVSILTSFQGTARAKAVSIFYHPEVQLLLEEQIREEGSTANPLITRFFHNKPINYALKILENYGDLINLRFLFLKGGVPLRYLIPNAGLFYWIELPLLLIGIFSLISGLKSLFTKLLVFSWSILGFLPAAITVLETPNIQRSIFALPPVLYLISYGIVRFCGFLRKRYSLVSFRFLISILILCYFYFISSFLHQYFVHQKVHRPWHRMYEMKELVKEVTSIEEHYEKVIMTKNTTDPYIYFLFYKKIDPLSYQKQSVNHLLDRTWALWSYVFSDLDCPFGNDEKILYIQREICKRPLGSKVLKEIRRPDNSVALRLLIFDPQIYLEDINKKEKP